MPSTQTPMCLACGSTAADLWTTATDAEYKTTNEQFSFYRCNSCGILFIDPVPRERLAEIYPPNYYSFVTQKDSFVNTIKGWLDGRLFRKILRTIPGDSLNALDVGGGSGWELSIVKKYDPRVKLTQVVDFDPVAAELAKQNGHEYFCGRIEDFQTQEKFDFVLMLNLIEHVENPFEILRKIASILTQNGRILIKTPNYDALDEKIFRYANWGGYHCPRHWVIFTKESFVETASRAGLTVKQFSYTQGAPFWASSMLFWMERHGWVTITKERPVMYHPLFPFIGIFFAIFDFARKPFAKTSQMFVVLEKR